MSNNIPVFTPPTGAVPTFTPPRDVHSNGSVCFHHNTEPAVASCARCGHYICQDCAEVYGVTDGEYAGKYLCYDCCQQLVENNVRELTANKAVIKKEFTVQLIGMTIGFLLEFLPAIVLCFSAGSVGEFFSGLFTALILGLVGACIGGVFLSFLKASLLVAWEGFKLLFRGEWLAAIISVFINSIIIGVKAIFVTIKSTIQYIVYLKKTSNFIEEDSAALQQMRDYMEYTLVRNQNKGVDLETLMNEGSQLYNNSYAQSVATNGEAVADAALRQATTRIAENGEIIRDFPGATAQATAA